MGLVGGQNEVGRGGCTIEELGANYGSILCCGEEFVEEDVAVVMFSFFCGLGGDFFVDDFVCEVWHSISVV